jgi:glycosyltransferase involved in cell wall biosynthesis
MNTNIILLLITQMEAAGAQKAMLVLARGLQQRGHEIVVVTMYDKSDYVQQFQKQYGVKIIDLQMKPSGVSSVSRIKHAVKGLWRLYTLLKSPKYNVIQTFSHYSNLIGPLIAFLARVPIRVSSQRMSLKGSPKWLKILDRIVTNSFLVDKMVAVSEATRQFSINHERIKPEKIVTIHNSIDLDRFFTVTKKSEPLIRLRNELALPDSAFVVLVVARLHTQKGHIFLIKAIPSILRRFSETHFVFVGEGELRQSLEDQARAAGIEHVVHFIGTRQDIPDLLALSDVFVLPSLWEGMPNSVLEAMAMGTPVVATNVDGTPEVINDFKTGLLVPPENSKALAEAVIALLEKPELRQQLSEDALQWVKNNFSQDKYISGFEQLYLELSTARKIL